MKLKVGKYIFSTIILPDWLFYMSYAQPTKGCVNEIRCDCEKTHFNLKMK